MASSDRKVWIGQVKVWLTAIFLPYETIKLQYKYLEKYPILLPVAWIQRIFQNLFQKKRESREGIGRTKNRFFEGTQETGCV